MEKGEGRSRATETRTSILTHLRCDLFFATISLLFLDSHFMGLFALGAGWISLFFIQGSRGGNDKRLHCLGTVEISGMCFLVAFYCVFVSLCRFCTSDFLFCFMGFSFLVHRFYDGGMGDTRYSFTSLPRGCGWLGLVASETMGCGVAFCLKSISWGSF